MSLAELLVALVTFGLVAAAAFTLLDEGQRAWAFGVARAETQQSARVALARLTGEIRGAGRGGRDFDAVGAPTAAPAEVRSVEIVLVTRPDYSVPGSTVSTALTTRVRLRNR